jgi:hypothetical protein
VNFQKFYKYFDIIIKTPNVSALAAAPYIWQMSDPGGAR